MKYTMSILAMLIGLVLAVPASAAPKHEAEKAQLRAKFESRYPQIRDAKLAGQIGETSEGLLEAVKPGSDKTLQKLITEENTDRQALYKLLAEEDGTDPKVVAERAAQRNFQKAKKGEYLKEDGTWRQK